MSGSVNSVFLIGNLGGDPEVKYLQGGMVVCEFSVATNRHWTDKRTSEKKSEVEWHNIVVYGDLAEAVGQHKRKGDSVSVQGRLKTSSWEDKETSKKMYKTAIIASSVGFL